MSLTLVFGLVTLAMLVCTVAAWRLAPNGDFDRPGVGLWLMFYWLAGEAVGRWIGWEILHRAEPPIDFLFGAIVMLTWVRRPAAWKWIVVVLTVCQIVASVAYQALPLPSHDALWRYRVLTNALYVCILAAVALPGIWDVAVRFVPGGRRFARRAGVGYSTMPGPRR